MVQASAEKLEQTELAEKERVASVPQSEQHQCHKEGRQYRRCQKEKEQSRLARPPARGMGENQGEREPHLCEREGMSMGRKG